MYFELGSLRQWWSAVAAVILLSSSATGQQVTLSLAATSPEAGLEKKMVDDFETAIKEKASGRITLERFFGGVLGGEEETLLTMRSGEIDMSINSLPGPVCYPEYDVQSIPFLFPEMEAVRSYYEGSIRLRIEQKLDECDLVLLGFLYRGARWTTANRPIDSLEAVKGFKIRLPQWPHSIAAWEALGAIPTPIPASEVFSALQTGIVDGHENKLQNIYSRKIWEVNDFLIATRHIQDVLTWVVSKKRWDALSDDDRKIIREAAETAIAASNDGMLKENETFLADIKNAGMTIIYPDLEAWKERVLPVAEAILSESFADEARAEVLRLTK